MRIAEGKARLHPVMSVFSHFSNSYGDFDEFRAPIALECVIPVNDADRGVDTARRGAEPWRRLS